MSVKAPQAKSAKVYVSVRVEFTKDGRMLPRSLTWEDGWEYAIDGVKDIRPAHAARAGGQGDRYAIMVEGRERYLFFEHNPEYGNNNVGRWFLERKQG